MKREIQLRFLIVLFIAVTAFIVSAPASWFGDNAFSKKLEAYKVTLGLDLAGGTELDYKVDLTEMRAKNADDDPENDINEIELEEILNRVRDAIEARVNPAGIGEIVVKRSQFDEEEHILVQMPPSTNVDKAKQDAERDNRLEFFEEDPGLENGARLKIAGYLTTITSENWDEKIQELKDNGEDIVTQTLEKRFKGEIIDQALAEKIFALNAPQVLQEVLDTQTETIADINEDGGVFIDTLGEPVIGLVRVREFSEGERENSDSAKATARHILFGFPDEDNPEESTYKTNEEAKAKAEEILQLLKDEGTDNFAKLAEDYSTGPSSTVGGDLGEFAPGAMVPAFNDAVFDRTEPGLVDTIIETQFGYHVIEVNNITPATTETVTERQVTFDIIGWPKQDLRWKPTELGGQQLEKAAVGADEINNPLVNLYFTSEGATMFGDITQRVASKRCDGDLCRLGIKVGGEFITTPTVREKINSRNAQITGNFTYDSAKDLSYGLNLGAIDAPVSLAGQITIQPELGAEQLGKSVEAGIIGLGITILFMILVYRFAGVVAGVALIIYAALFIMLLKTWPVSLGGPIVLTLSGAAGIALSIGLAVDGNILIFERMKEELKRGKSLPQAVDLGFSRAWSAIKDSNLTTLLTCFILYNLGSAMMKGFAITLIVGTLLSMFTAVVVSRNLLRFSLLFEFMNKTELFGVSSKDLKKSSKQKTGAKIRQRKK